MALTFDGTDDYIEFSLGSVSTAGALSVAMVARINEDSEDAGLFWTGPSGDFGSVSMQRSVSGGLLTSRTTGTSSSSLAFNAADGWCVVGFSYSGSGIPRFHKIPLGGSPSHEDGAFSFGSVFGTADRIRVARHGANSSTQFSQVDVVVAGWWNSSLSDANFNTLDDGFSAWTSLSPAAMWTFDTLSSISDAIGSANQTSRTGTTLLTSPSPFAGTSAQLLRAAYHLRQQGIS
jgi:hypothetical protein